MQKGKWLSVVIVLAILIGAVAVYFNQGPLPAYIDDSSPESSSLLPAEPLPEMSTFQEEESGFSVEVPTEWQKIIKGGYPTFVASDGTYLAVKVEEYDPRLNMVTQESITNEITAAGGRCLSFQSPSTSSYLAAYQMEQVVTCEYVRWSLKTSCRLVFSTAAQNFEQYQDLVDYIIQTASWTPEEVIPTEMYLYYNAYGSFEFGVPAAWNAGLVNDTFSCTDPETGAVYTVSVSTIQTSLQEISQLQYTQLMGNNRANLYLKNFVQDGQQLTAESVYSTGGAQMLFYHSIIEQGPYQYSFCLDVPSAAFQAPLAAFQECLRYVRIFSDDES